MIKALVPLAKGFEEIEAVTIIDVLRRGGIEVLVGSLHHDGFIEGAHKITLQSDIEVASVNADDIDIIVLPGGWGGTRALADDGNVQKLLQEMNSKHKQIAAICAAPYALYKAGVLKPNFTCYPSIEEEITLEGYQGDKAQVVEEGNIMTSRGPATAICFALRIVKKFQGDETYESVKAGLLASYCD
jgi:protein deglycase